MSHSFKVRQMVKLNHRDPRTSASSIYEVVRQMPADPSHVRKLEQQPFKLNQAQALSFRGREAEPGTHEHRRLRTVARPLRRRVYGSRALLRSPGMTEPGWVILNGFCSSLRRLRLGPPDG